MITRLRSFATASGTGFVGGGSGDIARAFIDQVKFLRVSIRAMDVEVKILTDAVTALTEAHEGDVREQAELEKTVMMQRDLINSYETRTAEMAKCLEVREGSIDYLLGKNTQMQETIDDLRLELTRCDRAC